jgi:signal transduction histidine kinase
VQIVLLSAGILLTATGFGLTKPLPYLTALATRMLLSTAFVYSLGENPTTGVAIVCSIVLEIGIHLPFPVSLVPAILSILAPVLAYQRAIQAFFGRVQELSYAETTIIALLALEYAFVSVGTHYRERLVVSEEERAIRDRAVEELSRSQRESIEIAATSRQMSAVEERNRITSEIHDSIGYRLTNVMMMIEAAQDLSERHDPQARQILSAAREQTQIGLDETRAALHRLRRNTEGTLTGTAEIVRLVDVFSRASGLQVKMDLGNVPNSIDPEAHRALYHVIQESLTNTIRHGGATRVQITFWFDGEQVAVSVSDNGRGATSFEEGIGLKGMRERVARLGGTVSATGTGSGFETRVTVPLETIPDD